MTDRLDSAMDRKWLRSLPAYLAATGVATYLIFSVLAYSRYPADFSTSQQQLVERSGQPQSQSRRR